MKKTVILEDLDCAHCAGKIEEAVNELMLRVGKAEHTALPWE